MLILSVVFFFNLWIRI